MKISKENEKGNLSPAFENTLLTHIWMPELSALQHTSCLMTSFFPSECLCWKKAFTSGLAPSFKPVQIKGWGKSAPDPFFWIFLWFGVLQNLLVDCFFFKIKFYCNFNTLYTHTFFFPVLWVWGLQKCHLTNVVIPKSSDVGKAPAFIQKGQVSLRMKSSA